MRRRSPAVVGLALALAAMAHVAHAQVAEPSPHADEQLDLMNVLAARGVHDLNRERWNVYGQLTLIGSYKPAFAAAYTNLHGSTHSLLPTREFSYTGTLTLYLAAALWPGGELYVTPELIAERPLSNLTGLGSAIQNFELQKTGAATPRPYLARAYLRQIFDVGGATEVRPSEPMQLGRHGRERQIVLTAGNFSVLDVFDKNSYAGDLRRQFFNMAFLTHAAFDFAADARGYAWGAVLEYIHDGWAVRVGRMTPPLHPNQLAIDWHIWRAYGDQIELTHAHRVGNLAGAVRLLGFRNHETMGRFTEALAALRADPRRNAAACRSFSYNSANAQAPDVCWVRRPQAKMGIGLNLEQALPGGVGVFARGMVADGRTEVYSYTASDASLSLGALIPGALWGRAHDLLGIGYAQAWISESHAAYLAAGGLDGFLGDGALRAASERVAEVFYSLEVVGPLWLSGDYQLIVAPGYNAARGPVQVAGARLHAEI